VKLIAETQPGTLVEHEVITIERQDLITPATIGLSVAVAENRHRGALVYPTAAQRKSRCSRRFGAAITHKSKARRIAIFIEHLAGDNLKV
jgi:hypothetical protein